MQRGGKLLTIEQVGQILQGEILLLFLLLVCSVALLAIG